AQSYAQSPRVADVLPADGILRNSVTNLHARGDTLWAGPFLNVTFDGGESWFVADVDSLFGSRNTVFSIDVEGPVIWAGLGFSSRADGGTTPAAAGYVVSTDGGETFSYREPHLDGPDDTTVTYGVSTLPALAVIVPEQSPPFDIDYDPVTDDVWIAAWASGIRRSSDGGRTWRRVVLPPDSLDYIHPDSSYSFEVAPQRGGSGHLNHMGFSILVDGEGTVWAGTPRGVNRSTDGQSWRRFSADGTAGSLTGSWVTSIEEQPVDGRNPIWMATWNAGEVGTRGRFGVTVTRDGGETFEQVLIGERIYDFAFRGTSTVYAAGERGLFITDDDGVTWRTVRHFRDAADPDRIVRPNAAVFAVATTPDALWVGTSDGLMKSWDGGRTWRVFRTDVPLHPEEPSRSAPDVDTYAYPNPFSPHADRFVRIRYESEGRTDRVRIFDFRMNLVREIAAGGSVDGVREVTWDGTDDGGFRVANGVYFYTVDTGSDIARGKIHVLQ
ncbi:MAG: FlgD immunoglobulin-like domain containing protein, partial [Rhodothermales bacterium]